MNNAKEIAEKILKHGSNELHRILARAYLELKEKYDKVLSYTSESLDIDTAFTIVSMNDEITKLKKSREALMKFVDYCCSWNEGEIVTSGFDSPCIAKEAREAIKADDEIMKG